MGQDVVRVSHMNNDGDNNIEFESIVEARGQDAKVDRAGMPYIYICCLSYFIIWCGG